MKPASVVVRVGQVWRDGDPRARGRVVRIVEVTDTYARFEAIDGRLRARGKCLLSRFAYASTRGFVLVDDAALEHAHARKEIDRG
jgi:hypothetical protein